MIFVFNRLFSISLRWSVADQKTASVDARIEFHKRFLLAEMGVGLVMM